MLSRAKKLIWALSGFLCWSGLHAQTTVISTSAVFSGTAIVLDFNAILPTETPITNQYSAQGVTFSGGLDSMTHSGDIALFPSNGGGVIASDWDYSLGSLIQPNATWTASFAGPETRVGFLLEVNAGDTTQITTFMNGIATGSVSLLSSSVTPVYFGAQNLSGFDSISVTVTGSSNHFLAIDDLRFEAVPEPSTVALLASGLLALGLQVRRRRATIAS
jgi:hypothetical protein